MKGLSSAARARIEATIGTMFDNVSYHLLGYIPGPGKKIIFSTTKPNYSLLNLFLESLGNREPNVSERDYAKSLVQNASNYVTSLRDKTKASISEAVDAYVHDVTRQGKRIVPAEINEIVAKEMTKARSHLQMIAEAESTKIRNGAQVAEIDRVGKSLNIQDPSVYFVVIKDGKTCKYCLQNHFMDDRTTPKVMRLSEVKKSYLTTQERKDGACSIAGQHPHCFLHKKGVNIFVEGKGYTQIDKVKIGDRVLTHTGKFKKVLGDLKNWKKSYKGEAYEIEFDGNTANGTKTTLSRLKVTPEHLFLTQRGWVEARNLSTEDKFFQLHVPCQTCGKELPVKKSKKPRMFCGKKCHADFQWKNDEHKLLISKKASYQMKQEWVKNPKKWQKSLKAAQSKTKILVSKGEFWAQKEESLETLQKNIAKINSNFERTSKEEKEFFNKVKQVYSAAQQGVVLNKFAVDVVIKELKIVLEYDGGGHYLPVYTGKFTMESFLKRQAGRDAYLNKLGYHVLRFDHIPELKDIAEIVSMAAANTQGEYTFKELAIKAIKKTTVKRAKLYDLTIEDDESFVVNSIVSHNCRCSMVFLAPGFGFKDGRMAWVGYGHDEYGRQKLTSIV